MIWNLYVTGGTVRTVIRQADALVARGRDVTIVSVICHSHRTEPFFAIDPRVHVELLIDRHTLGLGRSPRTRLLRALDGRPTLSTQFRDGRVDQASWLTDVLLCGRIARTPGVVIGTRMGINLAVARFAPRATVTIAQEHLQLKRYERAIRKAVRRHFPRLDLVASLTRSDAADYARALPGDRPAIVVVPNAIPDQPPEPADPRAQRVVTVGRLAPGKAFHLLIDAFALIADDHPGWTVRIIGEGPRHEALAERAAAAELEDRIVLVGAIPDVDAELAAASIFTLTSRFESFGLVLLEAMAAGVAIVSFPTPTGPRELLEHERNALVATPLGDVRALADQLARAMDDVGLRRRLATRAREEVAAFTVSAVTDRWVAILDELQRDGRLRDPRPLGPMTTT
ncbi:MAG: glycosyltransferase [Nitriliruptor sp.]|uniref:glycosyltransferase n=1 Tax=Nitriliruptor sp. TaxID=2448056 RepID=UPI0034A02A13